MNEHTQTQTNGNALLIENIPAESRRITGRIVDCGKSHCMLELPDDWGRARLHFADSSVYRQLLPMIDTGFYPKGKELRVFISGQRGVRDWVVHERWAQPGADPWSITGLKNLVVDGSVLVIDKGHGYFVQINSPDIMVFLPLDQIPSRQGGSDFQEGDERLLLEPGDSVCAVITSITAYPHFPVVSILEYRKTRKPPPSNNLPMASADMLSFLAEKDSKWRNLLHSIEAKQRILAGFAYLGVDDDLQGLLGLQAVVNSLGGDFYALHLDSTHRQLIGYREGEKCYEVCLCDVTPESIATIIDGLKTELSHRIMLIDLSLNRGLHSAAVGLRVAQRLNELGYKPALMTGNLIAAHGGEFHKELERIRPSLSGALRKPVVEMEFLARLARGEPVWQLDCGLSELAEILPGQEPSVEALSGYAHQIVDLHKLQYLVVLDPGPVPTSELLETVPKVVLLEGRFAADKLEIIMNKSELRDIVWGWSARLILESASHRNQGLRDISPYATFLRFVSAGGHPYLLGLGASLPLQMNDDVLDGVTQNLGSLLDRAAIHERLARQFPYVVRGQMLSSLGHEIANRLQPLLNRAAAARRAHRLLRTEQGGEAERQRSRLAENLEAVETAIEGLAPLMQMLLEGPNSQVDPKAMPHVPTLLENLVDLMRHQFNDKGMALHLEPNLPGVYLPYPGFFLVQPVSNLLLNSLKHKFSRAGGWARLGATVQDSVRGRMLMVWVKDDGPGIPKRFQKDIFAPGFSMAPDPSQRVGLGLYVSRYLVERVGGRLELMESENHRGTGCAFQLELPLEVLA